MKRKIIRRLIVYIDNIFRKIDKSHIYRTKNITKIPDFINRRGGKLSYAEWAHVIGIFQTIMYQNKPLNTECRVLDVGCGTGLLGISAEPLVYESGCYTGIDVMKYEIKFCKQHFTQPNYNFIHLDISNATYASHQNQSKTKWPIDDNSYNMVTALSVWTHLNEEDAIFYFKEIYRVLELKGRAIITFFIMDKYYEESLNNRIDNLGKYHNTNQLQWIFDTKAYDSNDWFCPKTANHPEDAIAVTTEGLNKLIKESGLKLIEHYQGNWKEIPGIFFQDILIFEKQS